jgi:hypothetical protein
MFPDWILIILKYTGGILTAFDGGYATRTEFRTEEGGRKFLTKKGYIGIVPRNYCTTLFVD